jgi:hypothetical protein
MGRPATLRPKVAGRDHRSMGSPLERDDVDALLAGFFDVNVKLDDIRQHLAAIRILLGEDEDEEQEDE